MKEKQEPKKKRFKVVNIVFWVVLALVAIYAVIALTTTDDSVTTIFGRTAFTVQTDSMAPTFEAGDLIYVETEVNTSEIEVGDVITYSILLDVDGDGQQELVYNSHRVTEVVIADATGELYFGTKGDNNDTADSGLIYEDHVIGVWTGDSWANMGSIIDGVVGFLKSGTGFFLFIVVPCFAFLVYEIFRFVGVMTEYKQQESLEKQKANISEEALAIARAQLEEEARLKALEEEKAEE